MFSLQYFQCMKDHIPDKKYFREVHCMFERFVVLPAMQDKDVNAECRFKQARGFLVHYVMSLPGLILLLSWVLRVAIIYKLEMSEDQVSLLQEVCFKGCILKQPTSFVQSPGISTHGEGRTWTSFISSVPYKLL